MTQGPISADQRGAATPSADTSDATRARHNAVTAVIAEVARRRAFGENLSDAAVIEQHPELQPELAAELQALHEMHRIFLAARRAGPLPDAPTSAAAEAMADPAASIEIQGYTIEHEISAGGQGTVFRATHDATGRTVAIKVIPGGLLTSSRHRARFEREAAILARLEHPAIVTILDRGRTADGSLFLVMPFIEGRTLDDHLRHLPGDAKARVEQLLGLFVEIAQAAAEAHRQGIIHRDLKPANVRVDTRGHPHVLDFGLARPGAEQPASDAREITLTGQIVGSLPWTSPEQVSGNSTSLDERSDIYALGVMLYQALTDEYPYSVMGSVREAIRNITSAVPTRPSQMPQGRARGVDARLDAIVMRALAKAPADRYASAQAFADDIEQYLREGVVGASVSPRSRVYVKWIAVTAAIALLGAVGGIGWHRLRTPARVEPIALPSIVNSVGMRLVRIPKGQFVMGSSEAETGHRTNEMQQPTQINHDFYMGTTEVTQRQYLAVMGELPSEQEDTGYDLPVQSITWDEATAFCRRLSALENRPYRLPKEAEWEYACSAGAPGSVSGGTNNPEGIGWYAGNSGGQVHPVAMLQPNGWGLYDMHGNVSEWCENAYVRGPLDRPDGRVDFRQYVIRGGNASSMATDCRAAARSPWPHDMRQRFLGFRVAFIPPKEDN